MADSTDILCNEVIIELLQSPGGVREILQDTLPITALTPFIHETTHHWCFLSPVGTTITALFAQSDLDLWRARTKEAVIAAASDRVVAETIRLAYQPIAEGISLFAQLNMRASTNPQAFGLVFEPCNWASHNFLKWTDGLANLKAHGITEHTSPEDVSDEAHLLWVNKVNEMLDRNRMSEGACAERDRLSQRPLDSMDNGYLPGYLLLKRAFNKLVKSGAAAPDPNSFLSFAKQYFFHDTELALMALTQNEEHRKSILDRIEKRLNRFVAGNLVAAYDEYVAEQEQRPIGFSPGRWVHTVPRPIEVPEDGDDQVHRALRKRAYDVGVIDGPPTLEGAVYVFRISMRDFIDLGSVEGRISSGKLPDIPGLSEEEREAGIFIPDKSYGMNSRILIPIRTGEVFQDEPATIDILFYSPDGSRMLALYIDMRLIHNTPCLGIMAKQAPDLVRSALEERRALQHNTKIVQAHADKALGSVFDGFNSAVSEQVREKVDAILGRLLFREHPSPDVIFEKLRRRGLFDVFDEPIRPKQLALFSSVLASGRVPDVSEFGGLLEWAAGAANTLHWPIIEKWRNTYLTAL